MKLGKDVARASLGLVARCTVIGNYGRAGGQMVELKPAIEMTPKGGT